MIDKESLIICNLKGGIGNQFFQIFFVLHLAQANRIPVAFDLSSYGVDSYGRNSILKKLWPEAALLEVQSVDQSKLKIIKEELLEWPATGDLPFVIGAFQEGDKFFVDGYWQDYRLVTSKLLEDLRKRLMKNLSPAGEAFAVQIKNFNGSIAVHVRRHDYKHHGLCNENYYVDSIRWLVNRIENPKIFLFSDEPNYATYFLRSIGVPIYHVATGNDLDDLYLMAACRYHVLSNSTYSWWGAALSDSQQVICPNPWSLIHNPTTVIYPPHWIKVDGAVDAEIPSKQFQIALDNGKYKADLEKFLQQKSEGLDVDIQFQHCAGDDTKFTAFDAHYVYHTAWAARRLHENPVELHIDIGSDIRFCTMASAFQKITFLDYRPAKITLSNLVCGSANLLQLDFADRSLKSLSCMHVVEHIGLGRYGDPIDYNGADIAILELQRVLAVDGFLYFVVPIGKSKVVFNAHRIFSPYDVVKKFSQLQLIEFSYVDDFGQFHEHTDMSRAEEENYACGCFIFKRIDY